MKAITPPCALAVAVVLGLPALARAAPCDAVASMSYPHMTVTLARDVPRGGFTPPAGRTGRGPGGVAFAGLPPFCRVAATLKPVSDSEIRIEVWLPAMGWNGRLESVGNGAWAGNISYPAMAVALAAGYATASTDTGHAGGSATFIVGHPEKLVDFESRAVHEMTDAAKAIVAAYYGAPQKFAYFNGCSTGGRQALTEAQRFPGDYDGIVAGAPANDAKHQTFGQIWLWQATHKDDASSIPPAKYQVIHAAAIAACDSQDGVKDGVIEDPTRCRFDPQVLACKSDDGADCLTSPQVAAARAIYQGAVHPRTKQSIYPGLEPGSELGWSMSVATQPVGYALDFFRYIVFKDEKWDPRRLNYDADFEMVQKLDTGLHAVDADLGKFVGRGGKLLMYAGWADPGIPPQNVVNYYRNVLANTHAARPVRESVRTFMVPGMAHCGGGEGTSTFDMVSALDPWVSTGRAPDRIPASRVVEGKTVRTRPLCPYPQVATYSGQGSTDDAANFVCRER